MVFKQDTSTVRLRWEAAAFAAGCLRRRMLLESRCNFHLQREVFPIKIEKQSIANGSFMLLNPVIYKGNASDWRHAMRRLAGESS